MLLFNWLVNALSINDWLPLLKIYLNHFLSRMGSAMKTVLSIESDLNVNEEGLLMKITIDAGQTNEK